MTDFKFGFFERAVGSTILLIMWALVAVLAVGFVTEHGGDVAEIERSMSYANKLMVGLIVAMFWGRPVLSGLPVLYDRAKQVVA